MRGAYLIACWAQSNETLSIITNTAIIEVNQVGRAAFYSRSMLNNSNAQDSSGAANRMWKRSVEGGELSLWAGSLTNEYDHLYLLRTIFNALSSNSQFVIAVLNTAPTPQSVDVEFSDAFFDQVRKILVCVL